MMCGRQGLRKYKYKDKHRDKHKDKYNDKYKYKYKNTTHGDLASYFYFEDISHGIDLSVRLVIFSLLGVHAYGHRVHKIDRFMMALKLGLNHLVTMPSR